MKRPPAFAESPFPHPEDTTCPAPPPCEVCRTAEEGWALVEALAGDDDALRCLPIAVGHALAIEAYVARSAT